MTTKKALVEYYSRNTYKIRPLEEKDVELEGNTLWFKSEEGTIPYRADFHGVGKSFIVEEENEMPYLITKENLETHFVSKEEILKENKKWKDI